MTYYIFNTENEAILTEAKIVLNIKNWIIQNNSEVLSSDLNGIKGKNAKTGEWDDSITTNKWAIPEQTNDGKWVFLKPQQNNVNPIPIEIALDDVNAQEQEYNSEWFDSLTLN
jgi:hypothetical protein